RIVRGDLADPLHSTRPRAAALGAVVARGLRGRRRRRAQDEPCARGRLGESAPARAVPHARARAGRRARRPRAPDALAAGPRRAARPLARARPAHPSLVRASLDSRARIAAAREGGSIAAETGPDALGGPYHP